MINHYLTIVKVANELHSICTGNQITDCITFRKNEFLFRFSNQTQFSVFLTPSKPFVFVSKPDIPPLKNVFHFFKELKNRKLTGVFIHGNDRVLKLNFEDHYSVQISVFSASSGIVLFHGNNLIESLKNESVFISDDNFIEISQYLSSPGSIDSTISYLPVSSDKLPSYGLMIENIKDFRSYFIYKIGLKEYIFPFQLNGIVPDKTVMNGSSELKYFVLHKINFNDFLKEKKEIQSLLTSRFDKLRSTIKQLETYISSSGNSELMERDANLLYLQQDGFLKGLEFLTVQNVFSDQLEEVTIKLDPNSTLHENAAHFFNRIKNFKEIISEKIFLRDRKKEEQTKVELLLENLEPILTQNELKLFKKKNITVLKERIQSQEISEPFHRIRSRFGYEIFVGKHAKGNDFLLSKIARKNDIWLHCKDNTGSHVIIPNQLKEIIPKTKIEEAASLAAFFSSQKKSDWVPVSYTFCKYVRKIKGSPPGAVVIDREEVIFVRPEKPPII